MAAFLASISQCKWVAEDQKIKADPDQGYSYPEFVSFLQEHKLPAPIHTANLIVRIGRLQQWNNQSVPELIVYLNKLKFQITPLQKLAISRLSVLCLARVYLTFNHQARLILGNQDQTGASGYQF